MLTKRDQKAGFSARPSTSDDWVRAQKDRGSAAAKLDRYTARLTINVTLELRGSIKIAAFKRGLTATEMLRALLEREFSTRAHDIGAVP